MTPSAPGEAPARVPRSALGGRVANQQGVRDGADAPQIRRPAAKRFRALQDLGHSVGRRALLDERVVGVENGGEAEISNLDNGVGELRCEEHAARTEVAMEDLRRMAVRQGEDCLPDVGSASRLLKPISFVEALHPILDVPALEKVRDYVEVPLILHDVGDATDVRVLELLQRSQPCEHVGRALQLGLWDGLASLQLLALLFLEHLNRAVGKLADIVLKDVLLVEHRLADGHWARGALGAGRALGP
mmetsp:Transcript_87028/g.186498  ORF Transcript_87028/g.186498 Transcript_87028/m.186498 type:complete len:246 (+) Transcript_87028:964-1701(+)